MDFDAEKGLLHLQAGVLLSEIIDIFVPQGWFLKVVPGTKLITVGGAIAADIHGKNHHKAGCFSQSVKMFRLQLPNGEVIRCSKTKNKELFLATCGGMGLTGIILDVKIFLKKISSQYIKQTTVKTKNLKETFEAFENYKEKPYSVAWIDCLAKDKKLGRCLLMIGDFCQDQNLNYKQKRKINISFYFPSFILNKNSVKIFNWFYYHKVRKPISTKKISLDDFFFPLDAIKNWNRIYGKNGFIQYQFILPKETSYQGLAEILKLISISNKGSFLAVLKLYGKANENFLSFPLEGYSLALDFKIEKGILHFLNKLDKIVSKYRGRIYLAKDARVKKKVFGQGYPNIEKFRNLRKKYKMDKKFYSLQSQRINI